MAMIYEKKEITLNFKEGKPKAYKLAPVKQQQVTFDKLLDEVSGSCGVNRSQSKAVIEALIDRMCMFMDFGMPVKLGEFGSFKPTLQSKAKETESDLSTADVKRLKILFYPGKRFKNMLANVSVMTFDSSDDDEELTDGTTDGTDNEEGDTDFT